MAVSTIDGTIEDAVPGSRRGGLVVFKSLKFKLDDGSSREITKAVVKQPLADELQVGTHARFYAFEAFDIRGVHGMRTGDGRAVYAFPTNNQTAFLVIGIINLLWVTVLIVTRGDIPLLGAALLILAVVGWYFMNKGKNAAKAQFDADAAYRGSPAPAAPLRATGPAAT